MGKHGKYRALVGACLCLVPGQLLAACRLALALGMDVSRSVNDADYAIQHDGLIAALKDKTVRAAMLEPPDFVYLALYEWSDRSDQQVILPWMAVRSGADIDAIIDAVRGWPRQAHRLPTGLGEALSFGRGLLAEAPDCAARTLDLSGDGQNNDGRKPESVYASEDFTGLVVNGLPIAEHETDIARYYEQHVIHGPGAFVEPAAKQTDFPVAIRRKLEKELSVKLLGEVNATMKGI